jgi:hypothetical protein
VHRYVPFVLKFRDLCLLGILGSRKVNGVAEVRSPPCPAYCD